MNREESRCTVCGDLTRKFLFNDNDLRIPMCSYKCENRYLDTISAKKEAILLDRFEKRINQSKHRLRLCWTIIGVGAMVTLVGFLTKTVEVFIVGASLATFCAFLARYFEERIVKLARIRERISV